VPARLEGRGVAPWCPDFSFLSGHGPCGRGHPRAARGSGPVVFLTKPCLRASGSVVAAAEAIDASRPLHIRLQNDLSSTVPPARR
jgi:hypothetical protein